MQTTADTAGKAESLGGHDISVGQRDFMEITNLLCLWVKDLENSLHLWLAQENRTKDLTVFGDMKPNFCFVCLAVGGRAVQNRVGAACSWV